MASDKTASSKQPGLIGAEHIPGEGGMLILPSRLRLADLLRVERLLGGRKIAYLIEKGAAIAADLRAHLEKEPSRLVAVTTHDGDVSAYRRAVTEEIRKGVVMIHVPAEGAHINAPVTTVPGVKLEFLIKAEVPVLPLYLHRIEEIMLPIHHAQGANDTLLAFGRILDGEDLTLASYQESLFLLAEECFSRQPALDMHLAYALLLGFKKHGNRNVVVDGKDEKELTYNKVLAAALTLAGIVKKETQKARVGIILPPGIGGLIANVAVLMAGKIPVNLNFTASRTAVEHAIKTGDIDRFLTADIVVRKMQAFPWPPMRQLLLIERIMPDLKTRIGIWLVLTKILPAPLLAALLGIPRKGGNKEALLLFTSGSAGNPKGVVLTHRNVIANVTQFSSRLNLNAGDGILGCLPLFHSFGCTVTLWYPILGGINLVTYPSPLEAKKLAELIEKFRVSLLIATPTFLRGYLRGVNREALASVKLCVTGAEKLPATVAEAFEAKFGKRVLEGYGLTETSPVSNINLPDPDPQGNEESGYVWLPSHRPGSVGQLVPGLAVRITAADGNERQSIHQSGMIWFKGPNVFAGYLNDPKRTADVIDPEGWFRTGDIGRVDIDGFLYIEGRLSRFSKIAGEMVPHETVEEAIVKAMGLENETTRKIAVIGVPDPDKGEALVLLTTVHSGPEQQDILNLRYQLLEKGLPALWIPKKLIRVNDIPILSSGKLDVQACETIGRGTA